MAGLQQAADCIYNVALQVLEDNGVDPKDIPLVISSVAHRLDAFAISAYASESATLGKHSAIESQGVE